MATTTSSWPRAETVPAAGVDKRPPFPHPSHRGKGGFAPRKHWIEDELYDSRSAWSCGTGRQSQHSMGMEDQEKTSNQSDAAWGNIVDDDEDTLRDELPSPSRVTHELMFLRNSFDLRTREPRVPAHHLEPLATRRSVNRMKHKMLRADRRRTVTLSQLQAVPETMGSSGWPTAFRSSLVPVVRPSSGERPSTSSSSARTISSASTAWYTMYHAKQSALSPIGQDHAWAFSGQGLRKPMSFFPKPGDWALAFQNTK